MRMVETIEINVGPQHPSTHGVFRAVVELDGEIVVGIKPYIGYLHRGIEKLSENLTYHQIIPITDRLDYMAAAFGNLAYCLAVEKLIGVEVPLKASFIRVVISELGRISSHLFWIGAAAHDLGSITPFFYAAREREEILHLLEMVTGSRITPSYFRLGGVAKDLPMKFERSCRIFLKTFMSRIEEFGLLLTNNVIWKRRTKEIGKISGDECIELGVSGPIARASGVNWDLRKKQPYSCYDKFEFNSVVYYGCDVYDRYRVRLDEIKESVKIIEQALEGLPEGDYVAKIKGTLKPPVGYAYGAVESPRGELGFLVVSDGSQRPLRVKVRSPTFVNLQALQKMAVGHSLSDFIAILASLDLVMGEVDR